MEQQILKVECATDPHSEKTWVSSLIREEIVKERFQDGLQWCPRTVILSITHVEY
jgi:hypothetical protein